MTRHIHADLIIQAANDTTIQWERLACNADGSFAWVYTLPKWLTDYKYRQKPAETKMVDMWLWAIKHDCGDIYISDRFHSTKEDAQDYNTKNIICRIEGSKITVPEVSQ